MRSAVRNNPAYVFVYATLRASSKQISEKRWRPFRGREHGTMATSPMRKRASLKDRCSPGGSLLSSVAVDDATVNKCVLYVSKLPDRYKVIGLNRGL